MYGGRGGLTLAADTKDVIALGHITRYPSERSTVVLQIPTVDGRVPGHRVVHQGACAGSEMRT